MPATPITSRRPETGGCLCTACGTPVEFTFPLSQSPSEDLRIICFSCGIDCVVPISEVRRPFAGKPNSDKKKSSPPPPVPPRKKGSDENPVDLEYYTLLGVEPLATAAQIKKGYYMMAMKCHPDKNPDDPEAEDKFKRISEAYQVLSDPQARTHYNIHGKKVAGEEGTLDAQQFFKTQFGGDKFADIIGDISLAKDLETMMNKAEASEEGAASQIANDLSSEERAAIERSRVATLTENLKAKLSLYVDGFPLATEESPVGTTMDAIAAECLRGFEAIAKMEAESLRTENYGGQLLHAVGYTYTAKADYYLAKYDAEEGNNLRRVCGYVGTLKGSTKEKLHIASEYFGVFMTAIDLQASFKKLQELDQKGPGAAEVQAAAERTAEVQAAAREKLEYEAATKGFETLWRTSRLEVERVLRDVCDKTLSDSSVGKEVCRRRAVALQTLGKIYMSVKVEEPRSPLRMR